jgi:hypothetical protein
MIAEVTSGCAVPGRERQCLVKRALSVHTLAMSSPSDHDPAAPRRFRRISSRTVLVVGLAGVLVAMAGGTAPADGAIPVPAASAQPEAVRSADAAKRVTGYWIMAKVGQVQSFGDAEYYGSGPSGSVAIAATPTGKGYWILRGEDGTALRFGDAKLPVYGRVLDWAHGEAAVDLAATQQGEGVWTVTSTGQVTAFGNARHFGDMAGKHLNQPIRGIIPTPSDNGYWLQATDGGVFSFGDAEFYGSTGNMKLNQPIVGMVPDQSDGRGYWLIAADGGVFSFDANFHGSTGNKQLNQPIIKGLPSAPGTDGYAMLSADGGIFNFGELPFFGSSANNPYMKPVIDATLQVVP